MKTKTYALFQIIAIIIFSIGFLTYPQETYSQNRSGQIKRKAKRAYLRQDFYSAKSLYEKYCKLKPKKYGKLYRLAELQRLTRDYKQARINYAKIARYRGEEYPLALYFAGLSYQMTAEYAIADSFYKDFIEKHRRKNFQKDYKELAETGIESCRIADSLMRVENDLIIIHLGSDINKAYSEFSPVPVDENTFWYAGIRSDSILDSETNLKKQFYVAEWRDTSWVLSEKLSEEFINKNYSTGNGCFSKNNTRFYFTRCGNNLNEKRICNLYVSFFEDGSWGKTEMLPAHVNNLNYTTTQPTIAPYVNHPDKEILYFVSDRPGGKGGMDIWYSVYDKRKNTYSEARNAGSKLNSCGDELSPFFDKRKGAFFFSSDGYPGLGGLDIFKTYGEKKKWKQLQNLAYPINSSYDDLYYTVLNQESGFFVSNRDGGVSFKNENCCDDIYSFRHSSFIYYALSGTVVEIMKDSSKIPVQCSKMKVFIIDEKTKESIFVKETECSEDGKFFIDIEAGNTYNIIASKLGYLSKSKIFDARYIHYSDTLEIELPLCKITNESMKLENVYFNFDSAELLPEAKQSIDTTLLILMQDNPEINIRIEAHTDSKGNDDFNLDLSKLRAKSITDYLTQKGISKHRLFSIGFGESKPIAPNQHPDGTDNPDGRQLNRRIEFRIE